MRVSLLTLLFISLSPLVLEAETNSLEIHEEVRGFLNRHCFSCHGSEKQRGDIRLDTLDPVLDDPASAQLWQDVLDVINAGDMPPPDEKQPPTDELAEAVGFLTEDLLKARKRLADTGGEVVIRRLTELEYINTIESLTGIRVPDDLVPDDESGEDFNTLGRYQTFSPAILEQYEEAARYAVQWMLKPVPDLERKTVRRDDREAKRRQKEQELEKHQELHAKALKVPKGTTDYAPFGFPNDAQYNRAISLSGKNGFYQPPLRHYLANPNTETGVVLYQASMGPLTTGLNAESEAGAEYIFRARVAAEPGMPKEVKLLRLQNFQGGQKRTLGFFHLHGTMEQPQVIETVVRPDAGKLTLELGVSDLFRLRQANSKAIGKGERVPGYWIDWVELEGPIFPGKREQSRAGLFGGETLDEQDVSAVLQAFAERAFRGKPVASEFVDRLMKIYEDERGIGKSEVKALEAPLTAILSAPDFLYLGEWKSDSGNSVTGKELATRLSYLLWKEPATSEMLETGDRLLVEPDFLRQSIDAMMEDPRFDRFVREFFGQWLHLRKYDGLIFDETKVDSFGRARKHFSKEQMYQFVAHLIAEDLSLENLIDSEFTFLNGTMANHYPELKQEGLGDEFVRVSLQGGNQHRGGLLGMAVIQAMGSTGEHTAPVERGAFILRKLLNSPPPPPPPNVPQLDEEDTGLSVREKLKRHREIAQCTSCHLKMDDMGLAMEHFNVVGQWRELENGKPIETAGRMPDGEHFKDFNAMKRLLMRDRDSMIESMVESLIAYSLGREAEFSDQDYVEDVVARTRENGYRFSSLVKAFVSHEKFLRK